MSRFANAEARTTVDLGPCECPGKPHDSDWARMPSELTTAQLRRAIGLDGLEDDVIAAGLVEFIPEWNLLGDDGQPWPPSAESIGALKFATAQALIKGLVGVVEANALPNGSGALSAASSPESASPTRKRNRTPTT